MGAGLGTDRFIGRGQVGFSRAYSICRWASQGSRAYSSIQREPLHISSRPNPILRGSSWFGSDGECTGYTPKGVESLLASQGAFRRGLAWGVAEHYDKRLSGLNVRHTCQILRDIGCGDDTFCWHDSKGNKNYWTANTMLKKRVYTNDPAKNQLGCWWAEAVSIITFTGGPPNRWGTYRGSLQTLLLDRFVVLTLFEGIESLDKILEFA